MEWLMSRVANSSASDQPAPRSIPGRNIPRRTWIAFGAAACLVTVTAVLFGPSLRTFAQSDESTAAYWRAERARHTPARVQPVYVTAYAPAQPSVLSRLPRNLRAGLPGPLDNLSGLAPETRLQPQRLQPQRQPTVARQTAPTIVPVVHSKTVAMCVRLCDGFHFPASNQALGPAQLEADCNSLCPNAPTRVYYSRSEKIDDAVAARTGRTYRTLPVAGRYASTRDNTCTCRSDGLPGLQTADIYRDRTLRRGDPVMTEAGFRIFKGSERWPYRPRDFAGLHEAGRLPVTSRAVLAALERASGIVKRSPAVQQAGPNRTRADLTPATIPSPFPSLLRQPTLAREGRGPVRMIGPQAFYTR
jgi:hypothetical protein